MTLRIGSWTILGLLLTAGLATGQPPRPVAPRQPAPARRPTGQPPPRAPFVLTPQQQAWVNWVLDTWEKRSANVKTFACNFTRWEYDPVFGARNQPKHTDQGKIKYGAPDRGMFQVTHTEKNKQKVPIEPERAEHWICDGKSIFEYNYAKRQLIEYKLRPELRGKAISDGPLPFLFGAKAQNLKQRYFIRIITPQGVKNQIWLEAFPRFQRDAANFRRAELILTADKMTPHALQIYSPNGKNRTVYQFYEIVTNDPLGFLKGNPFHASTPWGWKKIVPPPAQAGRPPPARR